MRSIYSFVGEEEKKGGGEEKNGAWGEEARERG